MSDCLLLRHRFSVRYPFLANKKDASWAWRNAYYLGQLEEKVAISGRLKVLKSEPHESCKSKAPRLFSEPVSFVVTDRGICGALGCSTEQNKILPSRQQTR